jgi:hypothetical protein
MQPTLDRPTDPRSPVSPLPDGRERPCFPRPNPYASPSQSVFPSAVPAQLLEPTPTYRPDPGGDAALRDREKSGG